MKKIFTFLFAMLFSIQLTVAQKTLYVYSESGKLSTYTANKIIFDNDLFTFTYGDVTEITKESFSASFSVAFKSTNYKFSQSPEVGICYSDVNDMPTITDGKIKKGTSFSKYTFEISSLDAGTTYYYRAYVKVNDAVYYGDVCSMTTDGTKPNYIIVNGHKFVDLGLPSGLLWAICNIGAERPAEFGNRYAWGETEPKKYYEMATYKYMWWKNPKYNKTDGKTTLDEEDDAAYVNWGDSCRMPTLDEFEELLNSGYGTTYCTGTMTSMINTNGESIRGIKLVSKKNGNYIFIPYNKYSYYWSSTPYSDTEAHCYMCGENSTCTTSTIIRYGRYYGLLVRPVAVP